MGTTYCQGSLVTARRGELCCDCRRPSWKKVDCAPGMVAIRGHVAMRERPELAADGIARLLWERYRAHGELTITDLEGSFTIVLADPAAPQVILFRNIVGTGFMYYGEFLGDFWFSSNLARLLDAADFVPEVNHDALPAFFLFRSVPGRETLVRGVSRLLPGEEVRFGRDGLRRTQRQRLGELRDDALDQRDPVDRLEQTLGHVFAGYGRHDETIANLLSGGVDSSYIQLLWNRAHKEGKPVSFSVSVDHPATRADTAYALSAAQEFNTQHTLVPADGPYADYFLHAIAATGEPPHHVQSAYFPVLARRMVAENAPIGLCGQGADALFGLSGLVALHSAGVIRSFLPARWLRRAAARLLPALGLGRTVPYFELAERLHDWEDLKHPANQIGAFTHWPSVIACFGEDELARTTAARRALLAPQHVTGSVPERVHACDFLSDSIDSASLWATLFNTEGGDLFCPFLDSRLLRMVQSLPAGQRFPFRKPKGLLKRALARHAPPWLAYRTKLAFGQPIFEWLAPGGQLRPLVEQIDDYDFVDRSALATALARPNWFLYSLLCFDVWHKLFIKRSLARSTPFAPEDGVRAPLLFR